MNQTIWVDQFLSQQHGWLASLWIGCPWVMCQPLVQSAETKGQEVVDGHEGQNMASWACRHCPEEGPWRWPQWALTGGPDPVSIQLLLGLRDSSSRQLLSADGPLCIHLTRHSGKENMSSIVIALHQPETTFPNYPEGLRASAHVVLHHFRTITAKIYRVLAEYFPASLALFTWVVMWCSQWSGETVEWNF